MNAIRALRRLLPALGLLAGVGAQASTPDPGEGAFRALYRELVEINTTRSVGSCLAAAEAMRTHLLAAGIPAADTRILVPPKFPTDGNLIAEIHGSDASLKPLLLLAHIDVVEARREDWERDPFRLVEENGWFYGRGVSDDKAMAAIWTDTMVRLRQENFRPRRTIKLALTCGEETPGVFDGVKWLTETDPKALDAEFALNEGASGELDASGRHVTLQIQAGEKVYQDIELEATDVGGHSSRPTHNNPIARLAAGIERLNAHEFPVTFNAATRGYFEAQARKADPAVAADLRALLKDPSDAAAAERIWSVNAAWNGMLRTTCVATQISGGHAANALPQRAVANVNCRILPGVPVEEVRAEIARVVADERISVRLTGDPGLQSSPPPLSPRILEPVRAVAATIWPGVEIVPTMSTGATDGRFFNRAGVPTYGLSGLFHDAEGPRSHGLNERLRVQSLLDGRRFLYEVVRRYAMDAR